MEKLNMQKNIPGILIQKILLTALIGIGCLLVGTAYYIYEGDRGILILSGLVLVFSLIRSAGLYRMVMGQKYEIIEGICISISAKPFRKQVKIHILDQSGLENTLRIGKQSKVKIGFRYRFYFKQGERLFSGNEYLNTILSVDQLLGVEELGEFSLQEDTTEVQEQTGEK